MYIEGRLQTRQWSDKDGSKRSSTDIVAEKVVFLGGGGSGERLAGGAGGRRAQHREVNASDPNAWEDAADRRF